MAIRTLSGYDRTQHFLTAEHRRMLLDPERMSHDEVDHPWEQKASPLRPLARALITEAIDVQTFRYSDICDGSPNGTMRRNRHQRRHCTDVLETRHRGPVANTGRRPARWNPLESGRHGRRPRRTPRTRHDPQRPSCEWRNSAAQRPRRPHNPVAHTRAMK